VVNQVPHADGGRPRRKLGDPFGQRRLDVELSLPHEQRHARGRDLLRHRRDAGRRERLAVAHVHRRRVPVPQADHDPVAVAVPRRLDERGGPLGKPSIHRPSIGSDRDQVHRITARFKDNHEWQKHAVGQSSLANEQSWLAKDTREHLAPNLQSRERMSCDT
jgi:hypothetical protein